MRIRTSMGLTAALSLAGCVGDEVSGGEGNAVAAVQVVPAGVGCLRVAYRASTASGDTVRSFAVTPGAPATLDLGALPAGSYTVRAAAYNVACASVGGSTAASWVGDPASVTVTAGYATSVALTLRPAATASTTVDFVQPARAIFSGPNADATYALMQDGSLRAWGRNDVGQLGDGTVGGERTPRTITGIPEVIQVAADQQFACAATMNNGLYCWGDNTYGQFADGTTTGSTTPRANPDRELDMITATFATLCGRSGHDVRCWGVNTLGGTGPSPDVAAMVLAPEGFHWPGSLFEISPEGRLLQRDPTNPSVGWDGGYVTNNRLLVRAVSATTDSYCIVTASGEVLCTGQNHLGQLGDGTTVFASRGVERHTGVTDATALASGWYHTCALRSDRSVWCWGSNQLGQVGAGVDAEAVLSPVRVPLFDVVQITAGQAHTCALRADGTVWCWGRNTEGQLGDGTAVARFTPVRVRI